MKILLDNKAQTISLAEECSLSEFIEWIEDNIHNSPEWKIVPESITAWTSGYMQPVYDKADCVSTTTLPNPPPPKYGDIKCKTK